MTWCGNREPLSLLWEAITLLEKTRSFQRTFFMALPSIIFKAELQISDMNRGYYNTHYITVARHPSETDERMMVRILAYALHASDALSFAGGLSSTEEPDLWERDLSGQLTSWIMVGQPDEKQIKKGFSKSSHVIVYWYGSKGPDLDKLKAKAKNLSLITIPPTASLAMAELAQRSMKLQYTIQDADVWLSANDVTIEINLMNHNSK
jgi:uncharacterized protein YaeQ